MNIIFARWLQRIFVLAIGIMIVYIAAWQVFPFFNDNLPVIFALLATYIFMAYVVIPLIVRTLQFVVQPTHIPMYCVTPDGFASDPINVGLVGTRKQIIAAMQAGGWHLADKRTWRTTLRVMLSVPLRRPYLNAPLSALYLFGHKQDLGFEKWIGDSGVHRHHVRFWACHLKRPEEFHADVHFWRRFHKPQPALSQRQLWVGAASKDIGLAPIRHNAQITHQIAPDTNAERHLIVRDLQKSGYVADTRTISAGSPYSLRNRALRGFLRADGKITICELKHNQKPHKS